MPAPILGSLGHQEIESLLRTRVAQFAGPIQHPKRLQDVVVPVDRVVEPHPSGVDDLLPVTGPEQTMLQEQLDSPFHRRSDGVVVRGP
jgi:hypothetical protein